MKLPVYRVNTGNFIVFSIYFLPWTGSLSQLRIESIPMLYYEFYHNLRSGNRLSAFAQSPAGEDQLAGAYHWALFLKFKTSST